MFSVYCICVLSNTIQVCYFGLIFKCSPVQEVIITFALFVFKWRNFCPTCKCFLAQGNLLNGVLILLMCLCEFIIIIIFYLWLFFAFIIYISSLFQLVRSKASSQGKHLQTHSSTVVLSLQVQSLQCRVFNKSGQPAKFASYFMSTLHLLFFGNYPSPKSQNLMLSLFCSNTLQVLLRNAVNALLKAQSSKFSTP